MSRTKIVVTLGPASSSPEVIRAMLQEGASVFRINTSHADEEEVRLLTKRIRRAQRETGKLAAILIDLRGPKIRLTSLPSTIEAHPGQTLKLRFVAGDEPVDSDLAISGEELAGDLRVGDELVIGDGEAALRVSKNLGGGAFLTEVIRPGPIRSHKGVAIHGRAWSAAPLTDQDRAMINLALELRADFVAMSFVRSADDLRLCRKLLAHPDIPVKLIAKVEEPQAVEHIEEIVAEADGVMVARGDLGVKMTLEEVPLIQKRIIRLCNRAARPVITATQMLESMVEQEVPTRAEVSDVANAILDGSDAVMLSGETSVGKHPVEAVSTMRRIAEAVESHMSYTHRALRSLRELDPNYPIAETMCRAAVHSAHLLEASCIVVPTASGFSARMVSRMRPTLPVFAPTFSPFTARQLCLSFGITPILTDLRIRAEEDLVPQLRQVLPEEMLRPGSRVVFVGALPYGGRGKTNFVKVEEISPEKG